MMVSVKVTGDASLIRAMSLLEKEHSHILVHDRIYFTELLPLMFTEIFLPDEQRVPLLMHNNTSRGHEHSGLLGLDQVVLSHGHSVFPVTVS